MNQNPTQLPGLDKWEYLTPERRAFSYSTNSAHILPCSRPHLVNEVKSRRAGALLSPLSSPPSYPTYLNTPPPPKKPYPQMVLGLCPFYRQYAKERTIFIHFSRISKKECNEMQKNAKFRALCETFPPYPTPQSPQNHPHSPKKSPTHTKNPQSTPPKPKRTQTLTFCLFP